MKTIRVIETAGSSSLLASEKGDLVYRMLCETLKQGESITLDFSGYEFLSSTFLNHSIGQISIDFKLTEKAFFERITIKGLSEDDVNEVKLILFNANLRRSLLERKIDPEDYYSRMIPAM